MRTGSRKRGYEQLVQSPSQQIFCRIILALLPYHHGSGPENPFVGGRTYIGTDNLALRLFGADWTS